MDSVNFTDAATVVFSPIHSAANHGRETQTPPPDNAAEAFHSSPLPARQRQGSVARKRTNEESWQPSEAPKTSPTTARFPKKSVSFPAMADLEGQQAKNNPFDTLGETPQNKPAAVENTEKSSTPSPDNTFVKEIHDYQQQLELEYQNFERSLNERDTTADLQSLNWENLEACYNEEIAPCIAREKEMMDEFNARFAQFMLYMQVSNDHEAERAVKRLRTRISLAQNSEGLLAQKQAHHSKVLEAFQSAMALLGNV